MRIAANLVQNISKTIQFGNVRFGIKGRRADIARFTLAWIPTERN